MRVQFFGRLGDAIGREAAVDVPAEGCSVAELRARLAEAFPHVAKDLRRPSIRACVDDQVVGEAFHVGRDATVEFFPPLSGG